MAKKKILVVDDETDVLELIVKKLEVEGYEVIPATHGMEAVDKAKADTPDLILLDIMLPDVDGAEVVARIKQTSPLAHVPILFLSGIVTNEDAGNHTFGLQIGGRRYPAIPKPFNFQDLMTAVRKLCPAE